MNPCRFRQPDHKCGYYPLSDGSPGGHCWAMEDSSKCSRTCARDLYIQLLLESPLKQDWITANQLKKDREQERYEKVRLDDKPIEFNQCWKKGCVF